MKFSRLTILLLFVTVLLLAACAAPAFEPATSAAPTVAPTVAPTIEPTKVAAEPTAIPQDAPAYDGPVTEIAIRQLSPNQDLAAFAQARDAFVALLTTQPGVGPDREFEAFMDGTTFGPPTSPVFTGMTQYDSLDAFAAAGGQVGASPEAGAFFSTFTPELFTALRPRNPNDSYDLAALATGPGQVLEIAVRDLSGYAGFDADDYATRLDAFLEMLAQQPGFVAEYQWVSVLDPNIVVGMTVYESVEAFQALATSDALLAALMPFIQDYPPMTGYIHYDARRVLVPGEATDGEILEIAVRIVPDEDMWWTALESLNDLLADEPAIIASQEFKSIFSAAPVDPATGEGVQPVYFSLGEYESQAAYGAMLALYMAEIPPALQAYLTTNTPILNVLMQPLRETEPLDVAGMVQPGQLLEIAIRDVSGYDSFEDFDAKRQTFVDLLLAQPGVLKEFEYRSLDGRYYIGMTLYESLDAFTSILSNPTVMGGAEIAALMSYPPEVSQFGVIFPAGD